jgi:presequence protease
MSSGHSYAMTHSARHISDQHAAIEQLSGVAHLQFLQGIKESDYPELLERLNEISSFLQSSSPLRFAVNTEERLFPDVSEGLESFLQSVSPGNSVSSGSSNPPQPSEEERRVFIPLQSGVNYCALSTAGVPYSHPDYPKLQVLATLLSYNYLHPTVREKGGAYGAGLRAGSSLSFYSYRDPNLERTLEAFTNSAEWIRQPQSFTQMDLEEAKLSLFGSLDAPIIPARKGLSYWMQGISQDLRQRQRDGVFATSREDLIEMADKYLSPEVLKVSGSTTVIGNAAKQPEGWYIHTLEKEPVEA